MGNKLISDIKNDNYKTALIGTDLIEGQTDGGSSFGTTLADIIARIIPNISTSQAVLKATDLLMLLDGSTPKTILSPLLKRASINVVSSADYTITDTDGYTEIWVSTGASDRTITLPTLADNQGRKIKVIKTDSGVGDVIVDGEGSETINSTLQVPITEQYGWWEFTAGASEWNGKTDGYSTIFEVSSETADTGLTLDGTWDDVTGMSLAFTSANYGKYLISARGNQAVMGPSNTQINAYFGLGSTSGNNAPNLSKLFDYVYSLIATGLGRMWLSRSLGEATLIVSSTITIYMKVSCSAIASGVASHQMYGETNAPMYIRARRIA